MKQTTLFNKKLNRWLGTKHEKREFDFIREEIYADLNYKNGFDLDTLTILCNKAEKYGCLVLGFETNIDVHKLYTEVFEHYCGEYKSEWWLSALHYLNQEGITDHIFIYIHVPPEILKLYT